MARRSSSDLPGVVASLRTRRSSVERRGASALVIACTLALGGAGRGAMGPDAGFRTDAELIAKFHADRASFDSLTTMLDADEKIRSLLDNAQFADSGGPYGSMQRPHAAFGGISGARMDTYNRLLVRTGAGRNVDADTNGILFTQWAQGSFSQKAWIRGYYYVRTTLPLGSEVITADLSADATYGRPPRPTRSLYRHIEGRWYLFSLRRFPE